MSTDDTENYMFTRTITDDHGRHGGLYHHTDKRGCTRTMRRIIFSHGRLRMTTENFWIILLVFLNRISVDIRDNPCEKQYRIIPWMFMECHGGLLYIYMVRAHAHRTHAYTTPCVLSPERICGNPPPCIMLLGKTHRFSQHLAISSSLYKNFFWKKTYISYTRKRKGQ